MGSGTWDPELRASREAYGSGDARGNPSRAEEFSNTTTSNSTNSRPKYRKYQIEKSTALGLLLPQSLRLEVRELDHEDHDLGLLYETTTLKWWECMATLPPKFLLLSAGQSSTITEAEKGAASEVSAAIAKISRPLGNLPPRNKASIEMGYISECFNKYSDSLPYDTHREWLIKQQGWKRQYHLKPSRTLSTDKDDDSSHTFIWQGSKSALEFLDDDQPTSASDSPKPKPAYCHGNLKFLGPDSQLLAVWKQRRDSKILGSLYVFETARECIPVEVVVVSCLYVVVVERILWTTFVGS